MQLLRRSHHPRRGENERGEVTPHDIATERDYRIQERIGISCGGSNPTAKERADAIKTVEAELEAIQDDEFRGEVVEKWRTY